MTEKITGAVTATDGMANIVAGLGAANNKLATTYVNHADPAYLEQAYRGSTWFAKIVDIPAEDATRKWRNWQAANADVTKLERAEKKLMVKQKVRDALILQRLHGGSVLVPIGLPGNYQQELDYKRIQKDSIKGFTLLSRYQIQTEGHISDVLSPYFNLPEWYVISSGGNQIKLHPSRVIRFSARRFTHSTVGDDGWGDSIWLRLADAIQNSETGSAVLAALLVEAKVDVIHMPDLTANMATERHEAALMRRLTIANQLKTLTSTMLLDKDDTWEQKVMKFEGLPDVVMSLLQIMCGAADIPITRLIGTQAKGMSNGGDADLKNYYDMVNARQELDLDPAMEPLNRMLVSNALGAPKDDIWHTWSPLYQMSEKEEAEVEANYAKVAETLVNTGLIPDDALSAAIIARMVDSGSWPALEEAIAKAKLEAEALKRNEEGDKPTPEIAPEAANEDDPEAEEAPARRAANDAAPRTLYARRDLLNGEAIAAWAKGQGFPVTLDPNDMHVTLAYSKQPVDWMKVGEDWNGREDGKLRIAPGGVRLVEELGTDEKKAITLMFTSSALSWRHEQIKQAGASWDHEEYQPHVTFTWEGPEGIDLKTIEPYRGELVFGPEVFEEVKEGWAEGIKES